MSQQDQSMFFNPDGAQEICPSIWLGSYKSLTNARFLETHQIKIIINCLSTSRFLRCLQRKDVVVSSDVVILSLDPAFDINNVENEDDRELVHEFVTQFKKILQNYLHYFYHNNSNINNLIHNLPINNSSNNGLNLTNPILGGNLKAQFFNIIRFINLIKVINSTTQILILSESGNVNLSTGLIIAYLMDCYKYNFDSSFKFIQSKRPSVNPLNFNYYDDLLIRENLKKFFAENNQIKQEKPGLLTSNYRLKRRNDEESSLSHDSNNTHSQPDDDMLDDTIIVGGVDGNLHDRKRRFLN
ncbi:uncharacterized protein RJT21DRAFT_111720 [Scheffersomyces amazonensis]|uniref:uncharacterized protein n=1 Tax=Scheffersomyces amazonensis TaxID=1078765 RepID=UPI00315C98C5